MKKFYSNGKLLLTGEYFVLEGATSLALPTKYGQDLQITSIKEPQLIWQSFSDIGECWLEANFDLPKIRLASATFESDEDGGKDVLAENLTEILLEIRKLNPNFLNTKNGISIKTNLTFPKNWGLGTSSTLINNLAKWAEINPYELLKNTFGGSGYDIAAAQNNTPILYTKEGTDPIVKKADFQPSFQEQLYFVYLNTKQNSREAIKRFHKLKGNLSSEILQISQLTKEILSSTDLVSFEKIIAEHEQIVSKVIRNKPIQEIVFSDYFGQTKSLGAWGGDFILATGNDDSINYFKSKGYTTVIPYSKMVLKL